MLLLVNGPNLNLLGIREVGIYGPTSLTQIEEEFSTTAKKSGYSVLTFQSNSEGDIIDFLHTNRSAEGVVINPGALTHYSYSLRDCLSAILVPTVEVHISNVFAREEFRHKSVISPVCLGQVVGFGAMGYLLALQGLIDFLKRKEE